MPAEPDGLATFDLDPIPYDPVRSGGDRAGIGLGLSEPDSQGRGADASAAARRPDGAAGPIPRDRPGAARPAAGYDNNHQGASPLRQARRPAPGQPSRSHALPRADAPPRAGADGHEPGFQPATQDDLRAGPGPRIEALREVVDLELDRAVVAVRAAGTGWRRARPRLRVGRRATAGRCPGVRAPRPRSVAYVLPVPEDRREAARSALEQFLSSASWPVIRRKADRDREIDLRPHVLPAGLAGDGVLADPPCAQFEGSGAAGRTCSRPWAPGRPAGSSALPDPRRRGTRRLTPGPWPARRARRGGGRRRPTPNSIRFPTEHRNHRRPSSPSLSWKETA